ncbi:hypothetical protein KO465_08990 [Candidatus Micrarchaeota archaeon]|nr:hypothetical protein [Candidatus Micrarchaeota archaeon]
MNHLMKKMKKGLSLLLTVIFVMSLSVSAFANSTSGELSLVDYANMDFASVPDNMKEIILDYAYMDIASAPDNLKETILEARNIIIYSQAWTVDGACVVVRADGTREEVPEFSELFPGWDVPIINAQNARVADTAIITRGGPTFSDWVTLSAPPPNTNTPPFFTWYGDGMKYTYASIIPGATYNLGYHLVSTGQSLGWKPGLVQGEGFEMRVGATTTYAVRASTYSTTGSAYIYVNNI